MTRFLAGYLVGSLLTAVMSAWVLTRYARWRDKVERRAPR